MFVLGNEVTVYGEKAGKSISFNLFWGTVMKLMNTETEDYKVTNKYSAVYRPVRMDLYYQKNHNMVFGHLSYDKSHASCAI